MARDNWKDIVDRTKELSGDGNEYVRGRAKSGMSDWDRNMARKQTTESVVGKVTREGKMGSKVASSAAESAGSSALRGAGRAALKVAGNVANKVAGPVVGLLADAEQNTLNDGEDEAVRRMKADYNRTAGTSRARGGVKESSVKDEPVVARRPSRPSRDPNAGELSRTEVIDQLIAKGYSPGQAMAIAGAQSGEYASLDDNGPQVAGKFAKGGMVKKPAAKCAKGGTVAKGKAMPMAKCAKGGSVMTKPKMPDGTAMMKSPNTKSAGPRMKPQAPRIRVAKGGMAKKGKC